MKISLKELLNTVLASLLSKQTALSEAVAPVDEPDDGAAPEGDGSEESPPLDSGGSELSEVELLFLECSIEKGRAGYLPSQTPFILLFAEKLGNDNLLENCQRLKSTAEITIFIGQSSNVNEDAILDCYELADYLFEVVRDAIGQRIISAKSDVDSIYNDISVVSLVLGVFTNA